MLIHHPSHTWGQWSPQQETEGPRWECSFLSPPQSFQQGLHSAESTLNIKVRARWTETKEQNSNLLPIPALDRSMQVIPHPTG